MALKTEARKPLYAVVGAGDLAVESIKELPTQLATQVGTFVPKTRSLVTELPAKVPALVRDLRGAGTRATAVTGRAAETYGELVERGQQLVRSIRGSRATEQAATQLKVARSQAKGAATSAGKAARATAKAVDNAAEKIG